MNGFLNLLKPPGMTSNDAVVRIRRSLGKIKVGHAGTLDPEAAGVLPLMIGGAARLFDVLTDKQKAYTALIGFGAETDTQDAQGIVLRCGDAFPSREAFEAILPRFIGEIEQTPPNFSALKIGGQPAYKLARQGQDILLPPRMTRIDGIDLIRWYGNSALIHVRCGRGTYIRTLCRDIGQALGCPAHMRFLLRTQSGCFQIENAVTLEEWEQTEDKRALLTAMDVPLEHLPAIDVSAKQMHAVRNGNPIADFSSRDGERCRNELTRIYLCGRFAGIGRWDEGLRAVRFSAMLLEAEEFLNIARSE